MIKSTDASHFFAVYDAIKSFEPGNTYLLVGRPGQGKTSLLMGLVKHENQLNKKKIVVYKPCEENSIDEFESVIQEASDTNVIFRSLWLVSNLKDFCSECEHTVREFESDIIFIDGIEYFTGSPSDVSYEKNDYKNTVYFLKTLALELNVPIVASFRVSDGDDAISFEERKRYGDDYGFRGFDQTIVMFDAKKQRIGSFDLMNPKAINNYSDDSLVDCIGLHYCEQNWNHYIGWNHKNAEFFDLPKKILLFGGIEATNLPKRFTNAIDNYASYGCSFIVGDNSGTDLLAQEYLASIGYKNVVVYAVGKQKSDCRINMGDWPVKLHFSEIYRHNGYSLEKIDWQKLDDHDEYIVLDPERKDEYYCNMIGALYFYETSGHYYDIERNIVHIVDGDGNKHQLPGPLQIRTPNDGCVYINDEKNDDEICEVTVEAGYTVELGKKTWGYRIPYYSSVSGNDYMELIHGDDWESKRIQHFFSPFSYSRDAFKEDCAMVDVDKFSKLATVMMNGDSIKELMDIAYQIKVCSCIEPFVVSVTDEGEFSLLSGQKRMLACILAGIKEVPCRYVYI